MVAGGRILAIIIRRWLKRKTAATKTINRSAKKIKVLRKRRLVVFFELRASCESTGLGSDGNVSGGGDASSIFFRAFNMELNGTVL